MNADEKANDESEHSDEETTSTLTEALARSAGLWQQGDGLKWQYRIRDEWREKE